MAIGRTEFQFSVTGANEAAAAHRSVARAADEVGTASMRAAEGVRQWDSMTMTFVTVAPKATDAAKKLNEQLREQAMRQELAARESTKGASALALVGEAGSKTIAVMMRLSYLLPGLGFAGMIGGIAAGLGALYDAMAGTAKGTGMMTAAMVEYGRVVNQVVADSVKKFDDLRVAQARAGLAMVGGSLGVKGEQLPFDQAMGAQKIQQDLEAARETQRKSLEGVAELERRRAALEIDRAKAGKLLPTDPLAIDLRRRRIEIDEQRRGFRSAYDAAAAELRRLSAPYESAGGGGGKAGKPVDNSLGAVVGRIAAEKSPRRGMEDSAMSGIGRMTGESYDASAEAARARAQEMTDFQLAQDQRNAMMMAHTQGAPGEPVVPSIFAMLTATEEEKAAFDQQLADAGAGIQSIYAETQRLAEDGKGMLTGLGKGLSTAAAASLLTGRSFKEAANNLLKSLAIQAAGQAIWETALGVGSLAMAAMGNPTAGASAALHFKAAGMFGVLAASFAGGASMTGGLRDGGGSPASGGGGGGGSSAAVGTGGGGGRGDAPVYVSVQIGEEPVAAIMRRSNEREARRGGMNGHFAMGAA